MSADQRVVSTVPAREVAPASSGQLAPLSVEYLVQRRALIRQTIDNAMEEGIHYGVIPGTGDRLALLKEGAELLLSMFQIAVEPVVMDLSSPHEVRFRVECRGSVNGVYVGSGIGICSSNEEKYRWRKAKSQTEFDSVYSRDPAHTRIKYGSYGGRDTQDKQVRQSPYDAIQTVLAMAEKRAKVDLAKSSLAASECLKGKKSKGNGRSQWDAPKNDPKPPAQTQNKTTTPSGAAAPDPQTSPVHPPGEPAKPDQGAAAGAAAKKEPAPPATVTDDQVEKISRILDNGIPDSAFLAAFEIGLVKELPAARFEAALAWLERNSP